MQNFTTQGQTLLDQQSSKVSFLYFMQIINDMKLLCTFLQEQYITFDLKVIDFIDIVKPISQVHFFPDWGMLREVG